MYMYSKGHKEGKAILSYILFLHIFCNCFVIHAIVNVQTIVANKSDICMAYNNYLLLQLSLTVSTTISLVIKSHLIGSLMASTH